MMDNIEKVFCEHASTGGIADVGRENLIQTKKQTVIWD